MNAMVVILADSAIKGIVLMLLAWVITASMRRSSAAARHMIWALGLGGLLLLPVLSLALPKWQLPILPEAVAISSEVPALAGIPPQVGTPEPIPALAGIPPEGGTPEPIVSKSEPIAAPKPATPPTPPQGFWIVAIWLVFSALFMIPLVAGVVLVHLIVRRGEALERAPWPALIESLSSQLELHRRVRLFKTKGATMPMAVGVIRPAILLPAEAESWPEEKRRIVLLHELAHIRRWDCLTHVITRLACVVHWFNPLAWMALHKLQNERERACDDLALEAGARPVNYAHQLLEIARTMQAGPATSTAAIPMARKTQLEGRLLAILDATRNRDAITLKYIVACICLAMLAVIPLATAQIAEHESGPDQMPEPFRLIHADSKLHGNVRIEVQLGESKMVILADSAEADRNDREKKQIRLHRDSADSTLQKLIATAKEDSVHEPESTMWVTADLVRIEPWQGNPEGRVFLDGNESVIRTDRQIHSLNLQTGGRAAWIELRENRLFLARWSGDGDSFTITGKWGADGKARLTKYLAARNTLPPLRSITLPPGDPAAERAKVSPTDRDAARGLIEEARRAESNARGRDGFVSASKLYEQATKKDPTNVDAWNGLGRCLNFDGPRNEELRNKIWSVYMHSLKFDPNNPDALIFVARTYDHDNRPDEARTIYDHVLQADPNNLSALYDMVQMLGLGKGDFNQVQPYIDRIKRLTALNPTAVINIVNSVELVRDYREGRPEEKLEEYAIARVGEDHAPTKLAGSNLHTFESVTAGTVVSPDKRIRGKADSIERNTRAKEILMFGNAELTCKENSGRVTSAKADFISIERHRNGDLPQIYVWMRPGSNSRPQINLQQAGSTNQSEPGPFTVIDTTASGAIKSETNKAFKTGLPSGVVVELVGISKMPGKTSATWWKPNGSSLSEVPIQASGNDPKIRDPNREYYELSYQLSYAITGQKDAPELSNVDYFDEIKSLGGGGTPFADTPVNYGHIDFSAPRETTSFDVKLKTHSGPPAFRVVAQFAKPGAGGPTESVKVKTPLGEATFAAPVVLDNEIFIHGANRYTQASQWQFHYELFDANGRQFKLFQESDNGMRMSTLRFEKGGPEMARPAILRILGNPRESVLFKNISLKPGNITKVYFEVADSPAAFIDPGKWPVESIGSAIAEDYAQSYPDIGKVEHASAAAKLKYVEEKLKRAKELFDAGALPRTEVRKAEYEFKLAKADLGGNMGAALQAKVEYAREVFDRTKGKHSANIVPLEEVRKAEIQLKEAEAELAKFKAGGKLTVTETSSSLQSAQQAIQARMRLIRSKKLKFEYTRFFRGKQSEVCTLIAQGGNYREVAHRSDGKTIVHYFLGTKQQDAVWDGFAGYNVSVENGSIHLHQMGVNHWIDGTLAKQWWRLSDAWPSRAAIKTGVKWGGQLCEEIKYQNVSDYFAPDLGWAYIGMGDKSTQFSDFVLQDGIYWPKTAMRSYNSEKITVTNIDTNADFYPGLLKVDRGEASKLILEVPLWREKDNGVPNETRPQHLYLKQTYNAEELRFINISAAWARARTMYDAIKNGYPMPYFDERHGAIVWAKYEKATNTVQKVFEGDQLPESYGPLPWQDMIDIIKGWSK